MTDAQLCPRHSSAARRLICLFSSCTRAQLQSIRLLVIMELLHNSGELMTCSTRYLAPSAAHGTLPSQLLSTCVLVQTGAMGEPGWTKPADKKQWDDGMSKLASGLFNTYAEFSLNSDEKQLFVKFKQPKGGLLFITQPAEQTISSVR